MLLITICIAFLSPFTVLTAKTETGPRIKGFTIDLESVVLPRKSRRMILKCYVDQSTVDKSSNATAKIEFQFNKSNLLNSSRARQIDANTLVIDDVTHEIDDGEYRCVATSEQGRVFDEIDYHIKTHGVFKPGGRKQDGPIMTRVSEGRPLEIMCPKHTHAYPVTYHWAYAGTEKFIKSNRHIIMKDNMIYFPALRRSDIDTINNNGGVACVMKTGEDITFSAATQFKFENKILLPRKPNVGIHLPKESFVVEGSDLKMICGISGYPLPTITWYRNGVLVNSNDSSRYFISPHQPSILTIKNADKGHEGRYKCEATNDEGYAQSVGDVILATSVQLKTKLQSQKVHSGEKLRLECSANGTGTVKYEWYRNGSQLSSYTNGNVSMRVEGGVLEINTVNYKDAGTYQCFVSNDYGSKVDTAIIKVGAPRLIVNVTDENKTDNSGRHKKKTNQDNEVLSLKYIIIIACASSVFLIVVIGALILGCRRRQNRQPKSSEQAIFLNDPRHQNHGVDHLPPPPKSFTDRQSDDDFYSGDEDKPIEFIDVRARSATPDSTRQQMPTITRSPDKPEHLYYAIPDTRSARSTLSSRQMYNGRHDSRNTLNSNGI